MYPRKGPGSAIKLGKLRELLADYQDCALVSNEWLGSLCIWDDVGDEPRGAVSIHIGDETKEPWDPWGD